MLHGHRRQTDEALLAGLQRQPLHATARGIGPVQHPQLVVRASGQVLEQVTQGGQKSVDANADILKIEQQHVEPVDPLRYAGAAYRRRG